jgi:hypothetical protein
MKLVCICMRLDEIYDSFGLAVRGLVSRAKEIKVEPRCPIHGDSPEAKQQREAFLEWRSRVAP